jgi:hypothetical protein
VWAEVLITSTSSTSSNDDDNNNNNSWIHLDPCEAAVNQPLLYEEWGKQQVFIIAFYAPLLWADNNNNNSTTTRSRIPLIEDVTLRYTSAIEETIQQRRDESNQELQSFMKKTICNLEHKLNLMLLLP